MRRSRRFVPVDEGKVNADRAADYFPVPQGIFRTLRQGAGRAKGIPGTAGGAHARYDAFVAKWGCFHDNDNREFIMLDSLGSEVFTLEMQLGGDIVKADILREPVAFTKTDPHRKLTPDEALASSLNFYGRVDMDYIGQVTDLPEEAVIGALRGEMFYNPVSGAWEHKGLFLAGNVIDKHRAIVSCLPDLSDREREWTEIAVKRWRRPYPKRYLMKSSTSTWVSGGSTPGYTPISPRNFSESKPR